MDREQFAAYLTVSGLADATVRNYTAVWLRWVDDARGRGADPERPDPLSVRRWAATLPSGRSSRAHARAAIGHACAALDVPDVSAAIPLPRQPSMSSRALPPADAARLADVAREHGTAGLAVLVGLYTAARRSEIASLAWHRVDLAAGTVVLERTKVGDLHRVPLHPALAAELAPRRVPGDRWVFPGRYGGHVSPARVWEWVRDVAASAGLPNVTVHQLRHTALTTANDATGDLRAVQQLAGHTDPAQTAHYTRANTAAVDRAVRAIRY